MVSSGFYLHFSKAVKNYTNDTELIDRLWSDIVDHYTEVSRHYHTLKHLEALVDELTEVSENISDWNLVVFAVAYHDIIYKPGRQKVLKHFLAMNRIYKTDHFFKKYEPQARINLANELSRLINN